ncbi:MAG TPA: hypothetical protein VKQ54_02930 [Caulobacteraceae bacterium]|nr:hypothetical protein [Caulobacteraceae bacterium]
MPDQAAADCAGEVGVGLDELHLAEMLRQEPLLTQSLARLRRLQPGADHDP